MGGCVGTRVCMRAFVDIERIVLHRNSVQRNTGLDETQAEIKIAGRNINNLRTPPLWQKVKRNSKAS